MADVDNKVAGDTPEVTAQGGDGSDLIDSIARELGPSPPPISDSKNGDEKYSGPRDRFGREFNPAFHSTNIDGTPRLTGQGLLRVKRGMAGEAARPAYRPPEIDSNLRSAGVAISRSFITVCTMVGGDAWRPSEIETEALDTAWAQYFAARGIDNVPPEVLLGVVLMGYAGPRLQQSPGVRSKLQGWYQRIRGNGTRPDNRDNSERKD